MSETTFARLLAYKQDIEIGAAQPGARLARQLPTSGIEQFLEALLATKQPRIFAESEIRGDGTDWVPRELALLGDINVTMEVKTFDNAAWSVKDKSFEEYATPFDACLMFTPGPLLAIGAFHALPPDYAEVAMDGFIDQDKYNALIERRLMPLFQHANAAAETDGKPALVVLPGIGAGAFAGEFSGEMAAHLDIALRHVLHKHGAHWPHIGAVCFDSFDEGGDADETFHGIQYRLRPAKLHPGRPQLSTPAAWQESGDDFSNHKLYKIVAWDHASLPGNDFFAGSRFTDDGVAAAATNSMEVMTGIAGTYINGQYAPPAGYADWEDVALKQGTQLLARGNVKIAMNDGSFRRLGPAPAATRAAPKP